MDLSYATFYPAEKTPENPKGYIDGEFHIFWKECFSQDCTTPVLGVFPGMRIVFEWSGPHNVLAMPNKRSYDSCDKAAGTNLGKSQATCEKAVRRRREGRATDRKTQTLSRRRSAKSCISFAALVRMSPRAPSPSARPELTDGPIKGSHCSAKDMKVQFKVHQLPPEF